MTAARWRWLLICARNRALAALALALIIGAVGVVGIGTLHYVNRGPVGVVIAAALVLVLLVWAARHSGLHHLAERLADDEREADPRQRL